tara:strand:+ start:101 stop:568 length:468 start_codon:yes stop_codon:yes gene_type:complete
MAKTNVLEQNSASYGALPQGYIKMPDADLTLLASDSGKVIAIEDVSADRTISLPAEDQGLNFKFWYVGAAADGHDFIIDSGANANYFLGGVVHIDADAGSGGDEAVPVFADGNSNSKLQVNLPAAGTMVEIVCNGTQWYVNGVVVSATAPAFADN